MDLPEAQRNARHHLGDTLHRCYRGGALADVWCVEAAHKGEYYLGCAPTAEAAAVAVATQLRAAGWVPSHARLVWYAGEEGFTLSLCIDQLVQVLWMWLPADGLDRATKIRSIQTWCAANLPSLHLPPFPGDKP